VYNYLLLCGVGLGRTDGVGDVGCQFSQQ